MKKFLVIGLAVLMVVGLSAIAMAQPPKTTDTQTFNFSATVQKHIEVNPTCTPLSKSRTIFGTGTGTPTGYPQWAGRWDDAVYANCPFTISYTGSGGGVAYPILSRQEIPRSDRYDRLQTRIHIKNRINGVYGAHDTDFERHDMDFMSGANGAATGAWAGQTLTFNNAPHDGEVQVELFFDATLPHKSPDFGPDNPWNESADAGVYTCTLTATYTAL